ncbi:PfkB family carbohydrate kinase [Kocuria rhizophila]|nr:PfkB family carbohydrate kinase [Kocuria rhizophila]
MNHVDRDRRGPRGRGVPQRRTTRADVGGSPMNVAVGLARVGHQVQFLGRYGQDEHGHQVVEHLRGNGVRLPFQADDRPTSRGPGRAAARERRGGLRVPAGLVPGRLRSGSTSCSRTRTCCTWGSIGAMLEPGPPWCGRLWRKRAQSPLLISTTNCRPSIIP